MLKPVSKFALIICFVASPSFVRAQTLWQDNMPNLTLPYVPLSRPEPPKSDMEIAYDVCRRDHWTYASGDGKSYQWSPGWEDCQRVEDEINRLKTEAAIRADADRKRRDREALNRALKALDDSAK